MTISEFTKKINQTAEFPFDRGRDCIKGRRTYLLFPTPDRLRRPFFYFVN